MSSTTILTRLDPDELLLLEALSEFSGLDRSALVKSLIRKGIRELRLEMAVEEYRKKKISLSRAAELSGLALWDFVARMEEFHLERHYDVSDFEQDLAAFA